MRKVALTFIVLTVVAADASAQQGWAAKMFPEGLAHDFGSVPKGAQLYYKFPVKNIYQVRMEVTGIVSGCGCVSATATKRVLEPRETAFIEINMDGKRFTGSKTVTVRVSVGPEFVSSCELRVSAFSRPDIVFNPGHVNFGTVPAGQAAEQTIEVEYAGALDWRVTEVLAKDVPVEATLKELYRRPGQVGYQLRVALNEDAPVGTLKQELFLKTNDPASPLVPVLVEAAVQAAIAASPAVLTLGGVKVGETVTRRVAVRANRPFVVASVEGLGKGLALGTELGSAPATVHILTFKCQPDQPGDFKRELKIMTDLQDPPVVVTISGTASQ